MAKMLFGSPGSAGSTNASQVALAKRLKQILSPEDQDAIRQALYQKASVVTKKSGDMDHLASANQIDRFRNSDLAKAWYAPEERALMGQHAEGLRSIEGAARRLSRSSQQVIDGHEALYGDLPGSVSRIAQGTATPEEIARTLGSAVNEKNGSALQLIDAIEKIHGRDSHEFSAARQGLWDYLTRNTTGKDQPGAQALSRQILELVNGAGRSASERLYTVEERELMRRYAMALRSTVPPPKTQNRSGTAGMIGHMVRGALKNGPHYISALIGHHAMGGHPIGLAIGWGAGKAIEKGAHTLSEARGAARAQALLRGATQRNTIPADVLTDWEAHMGFLPSGARQ